MRTGLTLSLLLHLGLIGWAYYSIQATEKLVAPKAPVIEAQLITVGEFTNLRKGDPNAKVMDAKAEEAEDTPPSKKQAEKARPKAAPDVSQPPPPPDPIAEKLKADKAAEEARKKAEAEKKKAAEVARKKAEAEKKRKAEEARKKAEAEKKRKAEEARKKKLAEQRRKEKERKERERKLAEQKRKEQEKKRKFDADRIAALLDKTPEKRGSKPVNTREPSAPTQNRGPTAGERDGRGDQLTARESDLLKARIHSQIANCWKLPGGGGGIDTAVVTLRWNLSPDGRLNGLPQVVGGRNDTVHRIAAEAAKRAVVCASPFTLPPDSYKFWQTIIWDFDPRQML